MGGKKRDIARAIVNSILDTLGSNDFVNIYRFSEATTEIVPCFKDMLVQVSSSKSCEEYDLHEATKIKKQKKYG